MSVGVFGYHPHVLNSELYSNRSMIQAFRGVSYHFESLRFASRNMILSSFVLQLRVRN
jgi:hypothetical protein